MRIKLDINSVAVKQLESAIWMYAYNYDEVAVHTIAGAAFEIYDKRLGLLSFNTDVKKYIKPEKSKEFISLWNKPYNFFKHGQHDYKNLDYIEYNEETVEIIIYLTTEANLRGDEKFRLSCANAYRLFFIGKYPDMFGTSVKEEFEKLAVECNLDLKSIKSKETLQIWLKGIGHTFLNGTNSPFRDIDTP